MSFSIRKYFDEALSDVGVHVSLIGKQQIISLGIGTFVKDGESSHLYHYH
jgi:hypothetical protein